MERFNWTLSEQLFGHQYAQEMWLPYGVRSSDWVSRLPAVIVALNDEETRLIGKKPKAAMKAKSVAQKPSSVVAARSDGVAENNLSSGVGVRYLYQPSKLVGGRRRATDPVWCLKVYWVGRSVTKPDEPVLYYLLDGPERASVREELLVVPQTLSFPLMVFSGDFSQQLGDVFIHLDCCVFVSIGQGVHSVLGNPAF